MWRHFPPSQLDRALHTPPMHLIIWYIFLFFIFCIYSIVYDHACKLFTMIDRVVQEESRSTGYVYVLYVPQHRTLVSISSWKIKSWSGDLSNLSHFWMTPPASHSSCTLIFPSYQMITWLRSSSIQGLLSLPEIQQIIMDSCTDIEKTKKQKTSFVMM